MQENDWVTWDYVTFWMQDGRPPHEGNMVVVDTEYENWRTVLLRTLGATTLHKRPTVWFRAPDHTDDVRAAGARPVKASDISDEQLLVAVRTVRGRHGALRWSTLWDVQGELAAFPPKVVLAKLRSAVKRGVLKGCACGCRGDFEEPTP